MCLCYSVSVFGPNMDDIDALCILNINLSNTSKQSVSIVVEESDGMYLKSILFDCSQHLSTHSITSIPCQINKQRPIKRNDSITSMSAK